MGRTVGSPLRYVLDAVWAHRGDGSFTADEQQALTQLANEDRKLVREFARALESGRRGRHFERTGSISTRNLALLPEIDELRKLCQSIAMLEAIICRDWEGRYYSFSSKWAPGAMCASMRDGEGDSFFIHFGSTGALIKGFAHEKVMSPWSKIAQSYHGGQPGLWPGIIEEVSAEFREALNEPAFDWNATTFCIWRRYGDPSWRTGDIDFPEYDYWTTPDGVMEVSAVEDPDGSNELLHILDGNPRTYKHWAEEYYSTGRDGASIDLTAVEQVYQTLPLTAEIVGLLNPHLDLRELEPECEQIGYPIGHPPIVP